MMTSSLQLQRQPHRLGVRSDSESIGGIKAFECEEKENHPKIQQLMSNPAVRGIHGDRGSKKS